MMALQIAKTPLDLLIKNVHVHLGGAHVLQGIDVQLDCSHVVIVGRNGMGKSTLCNAIARHVSATGSVKLGNVELLEKEIHVCCRGGIGYVPQGRRMWPSLTVDETLRLVGKHSKDWRVSDIYELFPRLKERHSNRSTQLSGGEQQMLAISRALLLDPKVLLLDEPSEGLAPVIVDQLAHLLKDLPEKFGIRVLLIEQNLSLATRVADKLHIMINGRIDTVVGSQELLSNRELQSTLLGVS
jgi:ABC-type branched-subunit amino acid transport system ATPase component